MKKLLLIATLCGIGFTAHADEGSYVGVGLGYATQKLDLESGENQHTGKLGAKIYGGYQFNDNFALEGGYHYLNKTKADGSTSYDKWTKANANFSLQGHLFSVAAVGIIPVNSQFSLFGKLGGGAYHAKAKAALTVTDFYGKKSGNTSKTKTHGVPVFGLGGEYKFDKNMTVRVEYENFGKPKVLDGEDKLKRLDMFSISFRNAFN